MQRRHINGTVSMPKLTNNLKTKTNDCLHETLIDFAVWRWVEGRFGVEWGGPGGPNNTKYCA